MEALADKICGWIGLSKVIWSAKKVSSSSVALDSLAFGKVTQDSRTKITTCFYKVSVLQGVCSAELVCHAATTSQTKIRLCKDNEFLCKDGTFFVRSIGWSPMLLFNSTTNPSRMSGLQKYQFSLKSCSYQGINLLTAWPWPPTRSRPHIATQLTHPPLLWSLSGADFIITIWHDALGSMEPKLRRAAPCASSGGVTRGNLQRCPG